MNARHPRKSYAHFLSKIFFMIKWTKGFFILMWLYLLHNVKRTEMNGNVEKT